ncbi:MULTISPECIES: CAP domain-containing protein [Metasolibacillus]|uniref:CAP domain-containing protein n=1 Tax=Metasolibacillus TaxID=2703677 RepID=UPI000D34BD94|nr:CAP domain-containing protein [Metasolibacillus fluoroglycofenilyticus]
MKKTLTAVFATFLLAAPIQMASASANVSDGQQVQVKQVTNCKVIYKWSDHKWQIVMPLKDKQTGNKWSNTVPTAPTTEKPSNSNEATEKPTTPSTEKPADSNTVTEKPTVPSTPVTEKPSNTNPTTEKPSTSTSQTVSAFEQEVVKLTNVERVNAGLKPFEMDEKLMAAAREKSQDMQSNKYFSHTSPTLGSPFERMKALGITYKSAGENIAQGQRTPQEVVQAWMDSPGHRANILNAQFTHIGVGYVENGNYWTQQFIQK